MIYLQKQHRRLLFVQMDTPRSEGNERLHGCTCWSPGRPSPLCFCAASSLTRLTENAEQLCHEAPPVDRGTERILLLHRKKDDFKNYGFKKNYSYF